ncbi:MAG: hybrid sensor histidine kinase/response regulator [Rhodanobacter denitrificans]|uniref:histidine kinase n=1 Tax=Rhodanobacter denitrificans TaxID=666685 RepID=A0A2W5KRL6_9GAMM|nr:MAG: hybrid sensor histidine kinase/response regulator [Rhodanobacter denitrificans]
MFSLRSQRSVALILAFAAAGLTLAMLAAYRIAERRALQEESAQVERQLGLYAEGLQQRIDRYRTLPQVLALDPELRAALGGPLAPADVERLNRKLERASRVTNASTLTLIDRHGIALAASNWREPTSNVGEDYSFRPYVQQALAAGTGHFYGIGLTTGQPGYFLSQAIRDESGAAAGVVVIKLELDALEREWLETPDVVLVSDTHGVIFLASRDAWRYRTLAPLGDADRRELAATRQYAERDLQPLAIQMPTQPDDPLRTVRVTEPALVQPVLWRTAVLPESGWRLHLLHDASAGVRAGRSAALAAGAAWLALLFLLLFVQQRRRLAALRRRSREELEAVLKQHAEELRTAQDGILTAARQADRGLARSLEHLPQGVVVIDADLRVTAWNSRYVELFSMPPDLVRVGRPIEDLFRYNARRGLLGPGPVEEAIERRLNHLRSGRPHMRESEKDDGTVLEIRGNPLPDGGFVTSYTDITSYKNAARELRSLADALEHRVAERTRDLAQAKREAEEANRYKSRFVASAVHDLLQPLNAARMFLSVLRGRIEDDPGRQIADHVDHALNAQDEILNSLLDIARLEAGTLQTQVRDFRLGPLLQTLGREFGILAAGRGLVLEAVAADPVVRSDETLLRRIVQNFLSNAVRYTPRGRIVLGCRRTGTDVRIEVHDQGPGIPESLHAQIFEEFHRLDNGDGNDRGAGLGLAIVDRIGRLLGHRIGVRSELGRGSVFSVTVPLGDVAAVRSEATDAEAPGDASPLHGVRVWCVDDDPRVCEATRALLQRWRCRVELAGGPHEARAACRPDAPPDLVLLDVRMGETDGPALYAELCAGWACAPPLVLVTAERDPALRALAHERGWGFLHKPVRPPALRALMTQLIVRRAG